MIRVEDALHLAIILAIVPRKCIDPAKTRKFRNVRAGNTKVALVTDDLVSANPWAPRYLRIYGNAGDGGNGVVLAGQDR